MFNAIKYSKELEDAGFSRDQAEATINAFYNFMDNNFATKSDIEKSLFLTTSELREDMSKMRFDLRGEISMLRTELKQEVSELRTEFQDLKSDFQIIRSEFQDLKSQVLNLEYRMTIKFGFMQAASVAILAAVIKLT